MEVTQPAQRIPPRPPGGQRARACVCMRVRACVCVCVRVCPRPCPLPAPSRRGCGGAPCGTPALGALLPPCSRRARQRSAAPQWKRPPIPATRSRGRGTSRARSGRAAPTAVSGAPRHAVPGAGGRGGGEGGWWWRRRRGRDPLPEAPSGPSPPDGPRSRRSGSGRAVGHGAAPIAAPGPAPAARPPPRPRRPPRKVTPLTR